MEGGRDWTEALIEACELADAELIREALAHGADPDTIVDSDSNETALFKVAWMGQEDTVLALVEAGANVLTTPPTAVHVAVEFSYTEVLATLLEGVERRGDDMREVLLHTDLQQRSCLVLACEVEPWDDDDEEEQGEEEEGGRESSNDTPTFELSDMRPGGREADEDGDGRNDEDDEDDEEDDEEEEEGEEDHEDDYVTITNMLLQYASKYGCTEELLMLTDQRGCTALHHVARRGNIKCARLLLEADKNGVLIGMVDQHGRTALHHSASSGSRTLTALLLRAGASPLEHDESGCTALHMACLNRHAHVLRVLYEAVKEDEYPDVRDHRMRTPLHAAASSCSLECCEVIVNELELPVKVEDDAGRTPLHYCVACRPQYRASMADCLLFFLLEDLGKMKDHRGMSAAHLASYHGNQHALLIMKQSGELLECDDNHGRTLLHYALSNRNNGGEEKTIDFLVTDVDVLKSDGTRSGLTPCHCAALLQRASALRRILSSMDDPDSAVHKCDGFGRTPLHCAAISNSVACFEVLLEYGAKVDALSACKYTMMHYAAKYDSIAILKAMKRNQKKLFRSSGWRMQLSGKGGACGALPHQVAAAYNQTSALQWFLDEYKLLLRMRDRSGKTAIHYSCARGHVDTTSLLLSHGESSRTRDPRGGVTPLHVAAANNQLECITLLLDNDAQLGDKDSHGRSVVHFAAHGGHSSLIEELLALGCRPDDRDNNGRTPLHEAAFLGQVGCVQTLLDASADIDAVDDAGRNAVHHACLGGAVDVLELLLKRGADYQQPDHDHRSALDAAASGDAIECIALLLKQDAPLLYEPDCTCRYPLHAAVYQGHVAAVEVLLKDENVLGKLDSADSNGRTAMHRAAAAGGHDPDGDKDEEHYVAIVKELIRLGAQVTRPDVNGVTPLMLAEFYESIEVAEILRAADPDGSAATDAYGRTVRDYRVMGVNVRDCEPKEDPQLVRERRERRERGGSLEKKGSVLDLFQTPVRDGVLLASSEVEFGDAPNGSVEDSAGSSEEEPPQESAGGFAGKVVDDAAPRGAVDELADGGGVSLSIPSSSSDLEVSDGGMHTLGVMHAMPVCALSKTAIQTMFGDERLSFAPLPPADVKHCSRHATVELDLEVSGRLVVAAKAWGPENAKHKWLAIHGWLDNANSFDFLLDCLYDSEYCAENVRVVCLDLAGHGRSQFRRGRTYHFIDYVADVCHVVQALDWQRFSVMGHSLGAGIAAFVAGTLPDRVERLVLIEGLGPYTEPGVVSPETLQRAVSDAHLKNPNVFPTLEAAARRRSERNVIGTLKMEAALALASRGCALLSNSGTGESGVAWANDPAVKDKSRLRLTEEVVLGFLSRVQAPTLVILAQDGIYERCRVMGMSVFTTPGRVLVRCLLGMLLFFSWIPFLGGPFVGWAKSVAKASALATRTTYFGDAQVVMLEDGGHHPHMDQSMVSRIRESLTAWLGW